MDDDFIDEQNELIETLGRDKLNSLAAKWFDPAQYQIVVVGDEKELLPKLKSLGIPVEVMTVKK